MYWAEKIDEKDRNSQDSQLDESMATFSKWGFLVSLLLLAGAIYLQIPLLWIFPFFGALYLGLLYGMDYYARNILPLNLGGYALTHKKLIELDHNLNIVRFLDASKLKHVYGTKYVKLKPIGEKNRAYILYFIPNIYPTINRINSAINSPNHEAGD